MLALSATHRAVAEASGNEYSDAVRALLTQMRQSMPEQTRATMARWGALPSDLEVERIDRMKHAISGAFPGDTMVVAEAGGIPQLNLLHKSKSGRLNRIIKGSHPRHLQRNQGTPLPSAVVFGQDCDDFHSHEDFIEMRWSQPEIKVGQPGGSQNANAEVQKLNQSLGSAWQGLQYSASPCGLCGVLMPNQDANDPMGLRAMLAFQNSGQAVGALLMTCHTYFGEAEILKSTIEALKSGSAILIALTLVDRFRLVKCQRCAAQICKRCVKLPHDEGGCAICTVKHNEQRAQPRLVCEECLTTLGLESWSGAFPEEVASA